MLMLLLKLDVIKFTGMTDLAPIFFIRG